MSSSARKNSLYISENQNYNFAVSRPPEGRIAIVTTRWARDAMDAARHRRMAVARRSLQAKPGLLRTAKSCGPGAAMLALSLAGSFRKVTVTTSPLHRGEHEVSRKAVAQGMSECSPLPCMLVCNFLAQASTRDRGCSAHPAFPAPSLQERDNEMAKPGRNRAAGT